MLGSWSAACLVPGSMCEPMGVLVCTAHSPGWQLGAGPPSHTCSAMA